MAYTDTGHHAVNQGNDGGVSVQVTLTGTTAGNLVVVGAASNRGGGPTPTLLVTDDKSNSYTNEGVSYADPEGASISWSKITTGGTLVISVSGNGANSYDLFVAAREFAGPNASPSSGSPTGSTGTSATADTTAVTPADNDVLVCAVCGSENSGGIAENTAPGDSGWTLSDENETSVGTAGSFVFKIITGAAGTPRSAWSIHDGVSSNWAARIKAFKPAASGGSSSVSPSVSRSPSPSSSASASVSPSPAQLPIVERTVFTYID